jgi:hypothetical protein
MVGAAQQAVPQVGLQVHVWHRRVVGSSPTGGANGASDLRNRRPAAFVGGHETLPSGIAQRRPRRRPVCASMTQDLYFGRRAANSPAAAALEAIFDVDDDEQKVHVKCVTHSGRSRSQVADLQFGTPSGTRTPNPLSTSSGTPDRSPKVTADHLSPGFERDSPHLPSAEFIASHCQFRGFFGDTAETPENDTQQTEAPPRRRRS